MLLCEHILMVIMLLTTVYYDRSRYYPFMGIVYTVTIGDKQC